MPRSKKIKLYFISGLGANEKAFQYLHFGEEVDPIFIPWLIPTKGETYLEYCHRMAKGIDASEDFILLGYSFGGLLVQSINAFMPAKKVIVLGSLKPEDQKSLFLKFNSWLKLYQVIPQSWLQRKELFCFIVFGKLKDPRMDQVMEYFTMNHPYYLKWSIDKILHWKAEKKQNVIQILADKDFIFPLKNAHPEYVIANATHLFPVTKALQVSKILQSIFKDL
ncbi:alpha/beta hydrolase [Elizabethkingia sp. JS20170427COW]|uniref:alpha/beta hydrolase n=1 Tax=Elizabethkingia sp. JS20170427COW TaxID=2583851 RepID=UPI0011109B50|nr:alpha/beta hydrolase [Elizabethkingia sp. JS20170427COW]QCX54066.1 alpha/beta hydrolase [Elizabethkingia sp. JS20170427COW]